MNMKKILLTLLFALMLGGVYAQENDGLVYPNTFYGSFGVGGYSYLHGGENSFGAPYGNLTGGVWISNPIAIQISVDGLTAPTVKKRNDLFLMFNAEFKWDVNSTFFHVYNKNYLSPIPFYPLFGFGALWAMRTDNLSICEHSFHVLLGLQAPFRISNYTDAFIQYKCAFIPHGFFHTIGTNYLHTVGLGLQFRQSDDPYHRHTERYTNNVGEDWFFSLGLGPNYSSFDLFSNPNGGGLAMVGITPEIMLGRNFSNYWTLRFVLSGLTAHEIYDTVLQAASNSYRFSFFHTDIMLNVSSLFSRKHGSIFNVMPYLGAGPIWRYDNPIFDVAADFGVMCRYYLTRKSDLYLDLRYVILTPDIGGGTGPSGNFYGVGLPSLTVGYIYNFGHNTTRYRKAIGCALEM